MAPELQDLNRWKLRVFDEVFVEEVSSYLFDGLANRRIAE